jgi:Flp pilus assembly protein CpaB
VVGRVAAGPIGRGAPVTEADLLGPGLLVGQDERRLAVPVRLADPAAAGLARRGDRVDLFAATGSGAVVADVVVLAEPGPAAGDEGGASLEGPVGSAAVGAAAGGAVVIVAVTSGEAAELARAQAAGPLSLAVHAT